MSERNSGALSITDDRDQAAGSLFRLAGCESYTTTVGPTEKSSRLQSMPAIGGIADQICSWRDFRPLTQGGNVEPKENSISNSPRPPSKRAEDTRTAGPALSGCPPPATRCRRSSAARARARRPRQPAEAATPSNYFLCRDPGAGFAPS